MGLVIAFLALPVPGIEARGDNPYFETRSEGSPIDTLMGSWTTSSDGREVSLEMVGAHVAGDRTWFEAGWLTPWTTKGQAASFETEFGFSSLNQLGETIRFHVRMRWRERKQPWGSWRSSPFPMEMEGGSWSGVGGGSGFLTMSRRSMRFEWQIRGVMTGTAELDGSITLSVN